MKKLVIVFVLVVACLMPYAALTGCARHAGPHITSTAYPTLATEPPEALEPVVYNRMVKEGRGHADLDAIWTAYAAQGSPMVGIAYHDNTHTMDIRPWRLGMEPYDTLKMTVESADIADGKEETVRIDVNKSDVHPTAYGEYWDDDQLISWSEIQQEVFDVLLACNFRLTDPELSTLNEIDRLVGRKMEGVSQHTAELEQLRRRSNVDVLILISRAEAGSRFGLNGRIWDLRTGRLIGADYAYFLLPEESRAGRILARRKARELVTTMLQQAAFAWTL